MDQFLRERGVPEEILQRLKDENVSIKHENMQNLELFIVVD